MRAFLSIIDSFVALSLVLLLLFVFCIQLPRESQLSMEAKTVYYKKVAEQILLTSAMEGYITDLVHHFELGRSLAPVLEKMLTLCPSRLSCLLVVYDSQGLVLCSRGKNPPPPLGLSSYFATTRFGLLTIVCKVGSR